MDNSAFLDASELKVGVTWVLLLAARMLWGKEVDPEIGRMPLEPFLISMCLIGISTDFFATDRTNPELSFDVFTGFRFNKSGAH